MITANVHHSDKRNNRDSRHKVIFLMGPTATGKTELAAKIRQRFPVEIISVDSMLVYQQMDIGTAKPDAQFLQHTPHRLIDFLDPSQPYSTGDFCEDALREIADIHQAGRIPLLVGGTMMYFRSLQYGLADLPSADPAIRARLDEEATQAESGWQALHERLQGIDPAAAERIHPNDPQRLQRALEVYELTGKTLTALQAQGVMQSLPHDAFKIILLPEERAWLHERIALRFDLMLEQGLLEEVRQLYERADLHCALPALRSVGYRQVWEYFDGKIDYNMMRNRAIVATRQLAKRQITWLRSERGTNSYFANNYHLSSVLNDIQTFLNK